MLTANIIRILRCSSGTFAPVTGRSGLGLLGRDAEDFFFTRLYALNKMEICFKVHLFYVRVCSLTLL